MKKEEKQREQVRLLGRSLKLCFDLISLTLVENNCIFLNIFDKILYRFWCVQFSHNTEFEKEILFVLGGVIKEQSFGVSFNEVWQGNPMGD